MITLHDLLNICEDKDIPVYYYDLGTTGCALKVNHSCIIGINQKFDGYNTISHVELLAHELGHCMCDSFITVNKNTRFAQFLTKEIERDVTIFVIKLLLPVNRLKKALRYTDDNLWNIADELGVRKELLDEAIDYYEQQGELQRYFNTADCGCY